MRGGVMIAERLRRGAVRSCGALLAAGVLAPLLTAKSNAPATPLDQVVMSVMTESPAVLGGNSYKELDPTNATFTGTVSTTSIVLNVNYGNSASYLWANPPDG